MLKYLVPRIRWGDVGPIVGAAVLGGWIGGVYGAAHDQATYTISAEYFTKLKFQQFAYADFGFGERAFASTVGFLATWWVGFIAAWFLGRRLIPNQPRGAAFRQICQGVVCVLICGISGGLAGYCLGLWRGPDADYSNWVWAFQEYDIVDQWAFVRVAYIHNGGYLGGLIGLAAALVFIRPGGRSPISSSD